MLPARGQRVQRLSADSAQEAPWVIADGGERGREWRYFAGALGPPQHRLTLPADRALPEELDSPVEHHVVLGRGRIRNANPNVGLDAVGRHAVMVGREPARDGDSY